MTTYTGLFLDSGCGWLVRVSSQCHARSKYPGPASIASHRGRHDGRLMMLVPKPDGFEALVRVYSRFAYVRELASRDADLGF